MNCKKSLDQSDVGAGRMVDARKLSSSHCRGRVKLFSYFTSRRMTKTAKSEAQKQRKRGKKEKGIVKIRLFSCLLHRACTPFLCRIHNPLSTLTPLCVVVELKSPSSALQACMYSLQLASNSFSVPPNPHELQQKICLDDHPNKRSQEIIFSKKRGR